MLRRASHARRGVIMFASIRTYEGVTDVAAVADGAKTNISSILEKSDGFISYTLVKAGHDSVVSISFFETYDQAAEANQAIRELVRGELNHLMPHPPKAIVGEVIGHLKK
jgi:hypothetical protein